METIKETENYKLVKDVLYGVTRFVRKADDAVTYWNIGTDAIEEAERLKTYGDLEFDLYAEAMEFYE